MPATSRPEQREEPPPYRIVGAEWRRPRQRALPMGQFGVVGHEDAAPGVGFLSPERLRALAGAGLGLRVVVEAAGPYRVVLIAERGA